MAIDGRCRDEGDGQDLTRRTQFGGAEGDRTPDLRIANATLSQLSYGPVSRFSASPRARGTMGMVPHPVKRGSTGASCLARVPFAFCATCGPLPLTLRSRRQSPLAGVPV